MKEIGVIKIVPEGICKNCEYMELDLTDTTFCQDDAFGNTTERHSYTIDCIHEGACNRTKEEVINSSKSIIEF